MNKLGILGATAALLTVPVLGISYAAAQGGADDPAGHVRHSGTDDAASHRTTRDAGAATAAGTIRVTVPTTRPRHDAPLRQRRRPPATRGRPRRR